MTFSDEIIVLNHTRFGDKAAVLHCLSRKCGRRSFLVRSADKYSAFFQPLNILECAVTENTRSALWTAGNFSSRFPLNGIRCSAGKNAISMFIAEMLFRSLKEDVEEPGLFDWCEEEIMLLDALEGSYANFHLRFLLDYAAALGFSPSYDTLLPFLDKDASKGLEFLSCSAAEAMLVPLSGEHRSELCGNLIKFLEFHLDSRINLRSLSVLSELFR